MVNVSGLLNTWNRLSPHMIKDISITSAWEDIVEAFCLCLRVYEVVNTLRYNPAFGSEPSTTLKTCRSLSRPRRADD
ncbi:MAG: hypothetical protein QW104_03290 [Nitrososphaerota archaeon]